MNNMINKGPETADGPQAAATRKTEEPRRGRCAPVRTYGDARAFERALKNAVEAAERNVFAVLLWAGYIRQGAEKRLGVGPTDLEALDDPAYGQALDLCSRLGKLAEEMRRVMDAYDRIMLLDAADDSTAGARGQESTRG